MPTLVLVTSGCYEIETSVRAMHVAGFDQVPTTCASC